MLRFHYPWASVPAIHLRQVESQEMSCYGAFAAHCLYVKGGVISQKPQGSSASLGHDMTTSRPVMPNFKRICHCKYEYDSDLYMHLQSDRWTTFDLFACQPYTKWLYVIQPKHGWPQKGFSTRNVFSWLQCELRHFVLMKQHANDEDMEYPQSPTRRDFFICRLVCILSAVFFMTLRFYSQSPLNLKLILILM